MDTTSTSKPGPLLRKALQSLSAVVGASAVACGAIGTHLLPPDSTDKVLHRWEIAVQYHQLHAVALLVLVVLALCGCRRVWVPTTLWCIGITLFCGSLYALALDGPQDLSSIAPIGGMCLIAGWLSLPVIVPKR